MTTQANLPDFLAVDFYLPPVRIKRKGLPSTSGVICTLVLNPPRLRPNAWVS